MKIMFFYSPQKKLMKSCLTQLQVEVDDGGQALISKQFWQKP